MREFTAIDHTSTKYVPVDVTKIVQGTSADITSDAVEMTFVPLDGSIDDATYTSAIWETDSTTDPPTYTALCLIGPDGDVELDVGDYEVFVRVTDDPEIPVEQVPGILKIN